MSSVWALLAAFEDPLQVPGTDSFPFEGAFVKGVDSISWMANNTKKLLGSQSGGPHCWTFLSTAAYGKRNKVPQVCFNPNTSIFHSVFAKSSLKSLIVLDHNLNEMNVSCED